MLRLFLIAIVLAGLLVFGSPPPTAANSIVVDGVCTFEDAVQAAETDLPVGNCPAGSGGDTIVLNVDVTLGSTVSMIYNELTITAGTASKLTGDIILIAPSLDPYDVAGQPFVMEDLTFSGSLQIAESLRNADVTIRNTYFYVDEIQAGLFSGRLEIVDSVIDGTSASLHGFEISSNNLALLISDSLVTNFSQRWLTLSVFGASMEMENTTFASNTSSEPLIYVRTSGSVCSTEITWKHVTMIGSTPHIIKSSPGVCWNVSGSVLDVDSDQAKGIFDVSNNLTPGTPSHFASQPITVGVDIESSVANNGGSIPTFALIPHGSNPAIDGNPGCGLATDQRGFPRNADCDIGAFELQDFEVPTDTPVPPTDTPIPPTDTPIPTMLVASAVCVDENLDVTISTGDGPFDITASAGINTPVNGVGIGTTTINGPEKWDNLTVMETGGDAESINLGQFKCRSDERPTPLTPAHRSRTTNPFPTFAWSGITGANNYRVFVFDDANPVTRTVDIRQNSGGPTTMQLTTPLPDGRLFWRVRGRQNRIWSLWSIRFTLFKDPAPPISVTVPTLPVPPNSR